MSTTEHLTLESVKQHPLWETQVALERDMRDEGVERHRDLVDEHAARHTGSDLRPMQGLIVEWMPKLIAGMQEWMKAARSSRGVKPIALDYFCSGSTPKVKAEDKGASCPSDQTYRVDVGVASLIALRCLLNGFASKRIAVTGLAVEVGRAVEHEAQVRLWEAEEPKLFASVQHYLSKTGATERHRAKVNINRFNALMDAGKFGFGWKPWGEEVQFRIGQVLIDNIVRVTRWFTYRDNPEHIWKRGLKHEPCRVVVPTSGLSSWIERQLEHEELLCPVFQPTVIPPRRWNGTREGGYWTPYVPTPSLIRFKATQQEQRNAAADEYEALDMPKVYAAVNWLQEVPWRVNKRVLDVAQQAITLNLHIGKLPSQPNRDAADRKMPPEVAADETQAKAWRKAEHTRIRKGLAALTKWKAASRTFRVAKKYADYSAIYFPHMLDFRGRMYPIPVGLQPQGDDFARGLLEFSEGRPITESNGGAGWLAINLATQFGVDKIDYEGRIAWVEEREAVWRRIAHNPIGCLDEWATADKPWAALAAIYDWVGFLEVGFGYVSHAPVSVDGTCNGIQHLSAMTRDRVAGEHVNLVPGAKPNDIYKHVAKLLDADLGRIIHAGGEQAKLATYWMTLCEWELPRSLTKRQVMVLPYGGTKDSFFTYTRKWLDEKDPLPEAEPVGEEASSVLSWLASQPSKVQATARRLVAETGQSLASVARWMLRTKRIAFLAGRMWDIVGQVVSGGRGVMQRLQEWSKHVTGSNQPIFWRTPCGFYVRHFYGKQLEKQIRVKLDGYETRLLLKVSTKDLDVKSQLQGIAPNFVHSLDASALVECILLCEQSGFGGFTAVHDAYGAHAADMWTLYHNLRAAFVATHSNEVLEDFRRACLDVLVPLVIQEHEAKGETIDRDVAEEIADCRLAPVPDMGDLELEDVLKSDYFFA